ncbi:MAG: hypothetical protein HQ567_12845 [Candidatus Nealsonbacteria bacterium]|nr:hypothetical protein [Candidatus Nealsonbacteria bacterium]
MLLIVHTFHGLGEPAQRQSKGTSASDSWIPDGDGWHVDKQRAFALRFPDDWEIRKDAYEGVAVIALSSEESTDDTFRENITVVAAPIRQRWDTKAFFDANVHDMRANAEGYQEHSTGTLNIGGLDCPWVSFSQKVQGVPTHVHSYCIASKGYGYAIMCAAAPDAMDRYEKQFESVVKTLKIPRE